MDKWQELFDQLEIINCGQDIFTNQQLLDFEAEKKIILPTEYKNFCQVFGTGMFGEFIGISCPNAYWQEMSAQYIDNIKNEITMFPNADYGKNMDLESILSFLDSAFVFGDDGGAYIAAWDLRTFGETDCSYDIYWLNADTFYGGDIYKIGRDFYEFVNDFCLGTKAFEILPQDIHPPSEFIYKTFTSSPSPVD